MKKKNKLTLQPGDYIVFHSGLKLENVGELVLEIPDFMVTISPVQEPEILEVKLCSGQGTEEVGG